MSERGKRKVEAATIAARLRDVLEAKRRIVAEEEALTVAAEALAEEPRSLLSTKLTLHPLPIPITGQEGDCSECGATVAVHPPKFWHFCPNCGSKVQDVSRETLQQADTRLVRNAIQEGLQAVKGLNTKWQRMSP